MRRARRGKNEESEGEGQGRESNGCLRLQHTLGSAPSAESRKNMKEGVHRGIVSPL